MKIKLISFAFIFVGLTSVCFAQDYKDNIRQRFDEFYKLTAAGKTEESLEYIPDTFFNIIPKTQMAAALKQVMNNKDINYKILDYKITEIADSKNVDDNYYSTLKYVSNLTMKFNDIDTIKNDGNKKARLNLIKLSLANTFGSDNVKLDETTGMYSITAHKKSCAVSKNGRTGWQFVNFESRQRLIMEKILPKEIIESF
ncbi:hypothetical protein [Mucilaginibacter glaciei]|uniref:DUF4919 domain-containing protein n=1 Tax=Mucilaginibacter glaciei TaxID=2772109 RepID=A0A926S1N7_9SPHI|nr:hypothetical protein [Mucilaginibacter glaciei]MBD1394240.1 hypothetical protein [Mucilaginibacter glaciei]